MTSFQWLKLSDKKRSHLFVNPPDNKWYDNTITSKVVATSSSFKLNELNMIQDIAKKEFQKEEDIYLKRRRKTGESDVDEKWIRDVAQSGTLSDKVAALALIIQESPIHNLQSFDTLLSYCSHKKEQRSCQLAMEAVKDLLIHNVLPDRKLNSFQFYCNSGYFHHSDMNMSILLTFWYEDQLITRIKSFIDNIEEIGLKSSNIEYFKKFCMEIVCDLLISKPEQEARLLNMLTNKLGDPMKGIIPKCIELLDKIISIHPVMKGVIVREVRQFLYRPHLPPRSLYAATNFLTSIRLTKKDMKAAVSTTSSPASSVTSTTDVASQLVECYISLFEKSTIENNGSESSSSSKLLSSLLQGVNRVYPFLKNKQSLIKHVDTLFKITHTTQFATAVQALTLISHIALPTPTRARSSTTSHDATIARDNATVAIDNDDGGGSTDTDDAGIVTRYYRALYSMLFSEQILSRTRNTLFFKLLFRSLKFDPSMERKLAFMKRLTILLLQCNSAIAAGILLLLSEACSNMSAAAGNRGHSDGKSAVKDTTIKTSSRQGQSNLHSKKQNDDDKRLSFFSLDKLFDFPAYTETVVLVDDQEHDWFDCYDARKREPLFAFYTEKEKDVTSNSMPIGNGNISSSSKSNLLHRNHMTVTGSHAAAKTLPTLWETALLKRHFHPSVQAFMNGFSASPHTIDFSGDPISDFSITAFLNRFAYKNPKKSRDKDTSSSSTSLSNKTKFSTGEEPINRILDPTHTSSVGDNEEEESSSKLTSDKLFFYKYFTEREKLRSEGKVRNRSKNKKSSRADGDGDDDEIDEDDEEEAIDMFADKLADDLMKNHAKSIDPDDDDDEGDYESDEDLYQDQNSFSDVDDDDDDDEDDDESDNGMDLDDFARKKSTKREANTSKSQLKSGNQGSSSKDDDEDSDDDDEDDDDGYNLAVYDSDEEVHHQKSKTNKQLSSKSSAANDTNNGKSKKRSKDTGSDDMSDFAAAEDYEKVIDQLMQKRFGDSYNNQTSNDIENRTQSIKTQVEVSKPKRRRQN